MSVQSEEFTAGGESATPVATKRHAGIVRVNLMPAELAEARQFRVAAVAVGGAAVLTLAGVVFLYHQQSGAVSDAKANLAAAQATNAQLQAEQSRLGDVDALYAKVDSAQAMLATAAAPQVLWSRYLEDLRLVLPEHVWMSTLAATEAPSSSITAVAATSPGGVIHPGATAAPAVLNQIGTLTFSGSAYTHNDVADALDRLASLHGVTNPYLASSNQTLAGAGATAVPTVTWSATAGLTSDALKSAYDGSNGATP